MSECVPDVPTLPGVFRLESVDWSPLEDRHYQVTAHLFNERASIRVGWRCQQPDTRLRPGVLVATRWAGRPQSVQGVVRVARGVLLERPVLDLDLFETVPPGWVRDRALVERGRQLIASLPRHFRQLFNAVFWEAGRFHRYCAGPSSLAGPHSERNGNLRHSLEVAEQMRQLCRDRCFAQVGVGVMAALLHDAGKADEYRRGARGGLELSDRGRLVGHRWTVLEWIAAARARWGLTIPEQEYLSLVHALTSSAYAPAWSGLRYPATPEATLLSLADRLSGADALKRRCAPDDSGWGAYHPHLKGRPYVLQKQEAT